MFNEPPSHDQDHLSSLETFVHQALQSGIKNRFQIIGALISRGLSQEEAATLINRVYQEQRSQPQGTPDSSTEHSQASIPSSDSHESFVNQALQSGQMGDRQILAALISKGLSRDEASTILKQVYQERYPQPKYTNPPAAERHQAPPSPKRLFSSPAVQLPTITLPPEPQEPRTVASGTLPSATLGRFWITILRLIGLVLGAGLLVSIVQLPIEDIALVIVGVGLLTLWRGPQRMVTTAHRWLWSKHTLPDFAPLPADLDATDLSQLIDELSTRLPWQRRLFIAQVLWQSYDYRAIAALGDMLNSENGYVAKAAANSLGYIGTPEAIRVLRNAYEQQRGIPAKQAFGNALVNAGAISEVDLAYSIRNLVPRPGCVAWYVALNVVGWLFGIVFLIAFGVFSSLDVQAYNDVTFDDNALSQSIIQVCLSLVLMIGLWHMRPWGVYLLSGLVVLSSCVVFTQNFVGGLIVLGIAIWIFSNHHRFQGGSAKAVPATQGLGSPTEDSEKLSRLAQLHDWLGHLSMIAAVLSGLVIAQEASFSGLIMVLSVGIAVVLPNWRVYRKLLDAGSYVPWGTLLVVLTMILLFGLIGLTLDTLVDLIADKTVDAELGLVVGLLSALVLGVLLILHAKTWGAGPPLGVVVERKAWYGRIRWGVVIGIMILPMLLIAVEPSIEELPERIRDSIDAPDAATISARLESRIEEGRAVVDVLNERWDELRQGGLVYCELPDIPVRIQIRREIADANPNLAEAVAFYDNGVDLLDDASQTYLDGCFDGFTYENMLEWIQLANTADESFDLAEDAMHGEPVTDVADTIEVQPTATVTDDDLPENEGWTCDDGANDVLDAARAAFDAGDLEDASELIDIAETICAGRGLGNLELAGLRLEIYDALQIETQADVVDETIDITSLVDLGTDYYRNGEYQSAFDTYELALGLAVSEGDLTNEGKIRNNIGGVFFAQGQYEEALEYYAQALLIRRQVGDRVGEGRTLNNIGEVHRSKGQYKDALEYYVQALAIRREVEDRVGEGITMNNIATVYASQGQYREALEQYAQALQIFREINDYISEGTILNNIATIYTDQGQYGEALEQYAQALQIFREISDHVNGGSTLNNIGLVYYDLGQYGEALDHFNQALAIHQEVGNRAMEGATLNNIGLVYDALGQYEDALEQYTKSLLIRREIGDRAGEGTSLNNIGLVYAEHGQYGEAWDYYAQSLLIRREIGDRAGEGTTLNSIGLLYSDQGQYEEALNYHIQALAISREIGDRAGEGANLANISGVYHSQGQYDSALEHLSQSLTIFLDIRYRVGEIQLFAIQGILYEKTSQITYAIESYQAAVPLIEALLNDAALDNAIESLTTQIGYSLPFKRLAVLLTQAGNVEEALNSAERGRAFLLRTDLTTDTIDFRANADQNMLDRETELRLTLDSAQNYVDSLNRDPSADAATVQAAEAGLDQARQDYHQHIEIMQLQGGYLARQISREVASLAEIQAALPEDTTLVTYEIGYPNSVVFLVTSDSLEAVVLDVTDTEIEDLISTFMTNRQTNTWVLADLYEHLITPIENQLTTSRLLISPDGSLGYVPFAALQAPDGSYLIDDYAISRIASATTLVLLTDRQPQSESQAQGLVLAQAHAPGLPALTNAPLEAYQVGQILSVEANLDATEADLRDGSTGNAIIHISAHAELDIYAPLFSVIHLAEDERYDGRFEVREIYELDLTQGTELVVLSGCNTAIGGDGDDYGLLVRAFFAAGAPRVAASLWSVDDAATSELMVAYIEARAEYENEADALRAAMLQVRAEYPEPYFWASFVLSGEP